MAIHLPQYLPFHDKVDYKNKALAFMSDQGFKDYAQEHVVMWRVAVKDITNRSVEEVKFEELEPEQIYQILDTFWEYLPDQASIRYGAFFVLCDFCSDAPEDLALEG